MAGQRVEECFTLDFNRFPRRSDFGVALATAEGLPEPFVDQPITLTALRAGQQQTAVIGFNGGHGEENSNSTGSVPIVLASKIVDHHFGWPKDFVATAITTLKGFKDHLVGL